MNVFLVIAVLDEVFSGPEAQFFKGPYLVNKNNVAWCPHNTRVYHAK